MEGISGQSGSSGSDSSITGGNGGSGDSCSAAHSQFVQKQYPELYTRVVAEVGECKVAGNDRVLEGGHLQYKVQSEWKGAGRKWNKGVWMCILV